MMWLVDQRPRMEDAAVLENDGSRDATRQAHNVLVIAGLDALTDEEKACSIFLPFPPFYSYLIW